MGLLVITIEKYALDVAIELNMRCLELQLGGRVEISCMTAEDRDAIYKFLS